MNRRLFITGLAAMFSTPALPLVAQEEPEDFAAAWGRRVLGIENDRTALRHVPAAQPFDEKQFEEEIRKRILKPPPEPKRRRRRHRIAYRRRTVR